MNNSKPLILLVDDDPDTLEFLAYNLEKEGYRVYSSENGFDAIRKAEELIPDLIVLDVMMPGMDGIETCANLRKIQTLNNTIIAFLTARGEDFTHLAGLDAGADDFIVKPVKPKILVSKVNSLLRRNKREQDIQVLHFGDLHIDKEKHLVTINNKEFQLPRKEFDLLVLLTSRPGIVFTRDVILSNVWGDDIIVGDRTIDVHIRKLREKLGNDYFKTIKGIGYKFETE